MQRQHFAVCIPAVLVAVAFCQTAYAAHETTVTLFFDKDQFIFDKIREFDRVRLKDGSALSQVGEPTMPVRHIAVAIPAGHEALGVRVRAVYGEKVDGTYRLFPGQPPARLDGSPPPPFVGPDKEVYSSTEAYPAELGRLDGQTDLAGQQMALVTVVPMLYTPATGRLILHRELEITVESQAGYEPGESYAKFTEKLRRHYEGMVRKMVVNPQDVSLDPPTKGPSRLLPPGDYDHVVITSSSYASYFDNLVFWHNKRGLRDTVVTTGWIYSNYSGADDPERIRNFVIDAHSTWGTIYFLMGGEDGTVPFKYETWHSGDPNTPSDNYYADYDDDWTCEVYVGRISGASSTEFGIAIDKVLNYERNPPTSSYPKDVLLVGMDLDASTPCEDLKETIDGYLPSGFNVTKVYDSHGGNHRDATIAGLNAGQNLVNHADHANSVLLGTGYVNHGLLLGNSHVDGLTNNGQLSNVVSMGCMSNDMTADDGIGEHFVIYNPNQAGISFTGNTKHGWYYVGYSDRLSCQLDRDWWRGLFNYDQHTLGQAITWSKHQFNQDAFDNPDLRKHCEWTFCLLGDPAMPLWTDTPLNLEVTHPGTLPTGSSSFLVHVESDGSDISDAYVCLWKDGDVYLTGYTDVAGDVTFSPSPTTTGTMYVTTTKHNYLPEEGTAEVVEGTNHPPTFTSDPIVEADATEDAAYGSAIGDDATDPDGDDLTFSKVDGPAWLTVAADGALSGTPTNADVGLNSWTVEVDDGNGGTDQAELQITVGNTNDPPVFTSDPIVEADATEDAAYGSAIGDDATDPDGDEVTFSKVEGPAWLTVAADGTLSGTPTSADVGLNSWTVEVDDGNGGSDQAELQIGVINAPDDPTVEVTYPVGGETLSGSAAITWTATDPDPGETGLLSIDLEYKSQGPWTTIATGETNDGSYDWDISGLPDGSGYQVRVTATDPTARSDTDGSDGTFAIDNSDDPTVAVTYPNGGETVSTSVTIAWTATDPNGDETLVIDLYYSDDGGGGWTWIASGETNDGSYDWDISGLADGSNYVVRATARDPTARSDTDDSDGPFSVVNTGPPAAVTDLVATVSSNVIHLSWTEVTEDGGGRPIIVDHYAIYRSDSPHFSAGPADIVGSTTGTSYDDATPALGDPDTNHYYVVRVVDWQGRESADSNRVGEFDFGLTSSLTGR